MLKFSKIDDELSIYKGKEIILFGAGNNGKIIKKSLEHKGFKIAYFCDNDEKKWGEKLDNIEIISPDHLYEIYDEKMLIQISCIYSREIEKQLQTSNISFFISFEEYNARMYALWIYKALPQSLYAYRALSSEPSYAVGQLRKECLDYALRFKYFDLESYNVICLPPKTGNHTLENSLYKCNGEYIRIGHCYNRIFDELKELVKGKMKIVTAVRDPIAQNISLFFQLASGVSFCDIPEFWKNGGDIQKVWDAWIAYELKEEFQLYREFEDDRRNIKFLYMDYINKTFDNVIVIQNFFEYNFERYNGINVYEYPFDKKKGYTIIQNEDLEIFIYQLEKLDVIKNKLGEFLGVKDLKLFNDNVGNEKWYASTYRRALKELKLEKEYYDYCYTSEYIKHFYDEKDIEKFRERWVNNLKEI
jgi:Predicted nucleoside-diphosphate sugar epimerases